VVRAALEREGPLEHAGTYYNLPYLAEDSTGLGKALRLKAAVEHRIPIFLSAMGPAALRLAGEIADGAIVILADPTQMSAVWAPIEEGVAHSGRSRSDFELVVFAFCLPGDPDSTRE
jgi:alkanesulfonate monooxygenase SsuD/methylene tetrahydromethanopterin reductase-like flavin-dependent oxidoreductase (luciferase family)